MRQDYRADLHVHTVLSPCAEVEMLPPLIIEEALSRGIQIIAITDHNASGNISAVQIAARGTGLTVLPGMELQTEEEVHVLCLFDTLDQVAVLQQLVDEKLPQLKNDPEHFGVQLLVDEAGELLAQEERMLLASVKISLTEAFNIVQALGGLFIPAHINRKAYGLIEVLGFVPADIQPDALEISRHMKPSDVDERLPQARGFQLIQNGDVHRLDEFMGVNHFHMGAPTISEIRGSLRGENGCSVSILA
jgi:3',5'-nucleoside bisphosphate phosphatase